VNAVACTSDGSRAFVTTDGNSLYEINVATREIIRVIDVSDPESPDKFAVYEMESVPAFITVEDGNAFISCEDNNIEIHDVGEFIPPIQRIAVSTDLIEFGECEVGENLSATFEISNTGDAELIVSSIVSDNENSLIRMETPVHFVEGDHVYQVEPGHCHINPDCFASRRLCERSEAISPSRRLARNDKGF
jgi:hypothetical protein